MAVNIAKYNLSEKFWNLDLKIFSNYETFNIYLFVEYFYMLNSLVKYFEENYKYDELFNIEINIELLKTIIDKDIVNKYIDIISDLLIDDLMKMIYKKNKKI